jgi:predicted DNA-binding antitoxin AbrB/MazE fold protein
MISQITATFVNGILKPDQALPLADQTRVKLTIEPIQDWSLDASLAAWEAIKAQLRQRPLHFGGQRYTRDELHERR